MSGETNMTLITYAVSQTVRTDRQPQEVLDYVPREDQENEQKV